MRSRRHTGQRQPIADPLPPNPLDVELTLTHMYAAMRALRPREVTRLGWDCVEATTSNSSLIPLSAELYILLSISMHLSDLPRMLAEDKLQSAQLYPDYERAYQQIWSLHYLGSLALCFAQRRQKHMADKLVALLEHRQGPESPVPLAYLRGRINELLGDNQAAFEYLVQAEHDWQGLDHRNETELFACRLWLIVLAVQLGHQEVVKQVSMRILGSKHPVTVRQVKLIRRFRRWGKWGWLITHK